MIDDLVFRFLDGSGVELPPRLGNRTSRCEVGQPAVEP